MTPDELSDAVLAAVRAAVDAGDLAVPVPDAVTVERPKVKEHGDYATNIALQLAKPAGRPPREVAEAIAARLARSADGIATVDVAGPGFLNITLDSAAQGELARTVVDGGRGVRPQRRRSAGQRINLEFVSANPTGPLHLGARPVGGGRRRPGPGARGRPAPRSPASTTSTTPACRSTASPQSLLAAAKGEPTPEDGYGGAYIGEIAAAVVAGRPDVLDLPDDDARWPSSGSDGVDLMFEEIRQSLRRLRRRLRRLLQREGRCTTRARSTRRSTRLRRPGTSTSTTARCGCGRPTSATTRTGCWSSRRRADLLRRRLRLLPRQARARLRPRRDHARRRPPRLRRPLRALVAAFGDDPDVNLEILIGQMVNLLQGRQAAADEQAGRHRASRSRTSSRRSASTPAATPWPATRPTRRIDIDLDLWAKRTSDNPVFYVQYAHARVASLLRNAAELGLDKRRPAIPSCSTHEREGDLLGALGEFPRVVATAAELREPHRVARYLEELAGTYHRFYDDCRVLPRGDEEVTDLHRARLLAGRGDPRRAGQRPRPARRQRARADVDAVRAHPAGPAARRRSLHEALRARSAGRPRRARPRGLAARRRRASTPAR